MRKIGFFAAIIATLIGGNLVAAYLLPKPWNWGVVIVLSISWWAATLFLAYTSIKED